MYPTKGITWRHMATVTIRCLPQRSIHACWLYEYRSPGRLENSNLASLIILSSTYRRMIFLARGWNTAANTSTMARPRRDCGVTRSQLPMPSHDNRRHGTRRKSPLQTTTKKKKLLWYSSAKLYLRFVAAAIPWGISHPTQEFEFVQARRPC